MNATAGFHVDACRTCRARIVWAETDSQRAMPIDAEPHPDGALLLSVFGGPDGQRRVHVSFVRPSRRADHAGQLHRSHFATCPDAAWHRAPSRRA